jgi:hypothetical protein
VTFYGNKSGPNNLVHLSLIGGIMVLLYSLLSLSMFALHGSYWGGIDEWMSGMMGNYHDFMGIYGASTEFLTVISIICLVSGHHGDWRSDAEGTPTRTRDVGHCNNFLFGNQIRRHGRLLHWRLTGHNRRRMRHQLQTRSRKNVKAKRNITIYQGLHSLSS